MVTRELTPSQTVGWPSRGWGLLDRYRPRIRNLSRADLVIALGVVGLLVRLRLAISSLGSNDIMSWAAFGRAIRLTGLGDVYDNIPLFNHPPLMGWMAALVDGLANRFGLRFELLFKVPIILADAIGGLLVYRAWRRNRGRTYAAIAFCFFCWNPVSILISAYHGNTDSLCSMLMLLAAFYMDRGRAFLAGLALAGSINVKLVGVLLIPVVLSGARNGRQALHATGALLLGALPFLPFLWFHWSTFRGHVIGYRSTPGYWGITQFLIAAIKTPRFSVTGTSLLTAYSTLSVKLILLAPVVLGILNRRTGRRRWSVAELGAVVCCLFLVITPGFGVQYMVYPVILLFAVNLTRAVAYAVVAGGYVGVIYFGLWTGTSPAFSDFYNPYPAASEALGYLTWGVLLQTVVDLLRRARGPRQPPLRDRSMVRGLLSAISWRSGQPSAPAARPHVASHDDEK